MKIKKNLKESRNCKTEDLTAKIIKMLEKA